MFVLVNIILAATTLCLYAVASGRFYRREKPFLGIFVAAVVSDVATAFLASFKLTPTTQLGGPHVVPWTSPLFLLHITSSSLGMFGFIAVLLVLLIKGKEFPYPRLRKFQRRILLPAWMIGQTIALSNAAGKILFKVRIYDYFHF
jgi:hypothetical protein